MQTASFHRIQLSVPLPLSILLPAPLSPDSQKENFQPECKMNDEGFFGCFISARSFWASPGGFLPHLRASHTQRLVSGRKLLSGKGR